MRSHERRTKTQLLHENQQLRLRLEEAEQTLQAIRSGDVDALVVEGPQGEHVFSLSGAEHIYRVIAETMHEAALIVGLDGIILFCNQRFYDLTKTPMNEALGHNLKGFVSPPQEQPLEKLLADVQAGPVQRRLTLRASDGKAIPVQLSASLIEEDSITSICLLASDLTEIEASARSIRVLGEHQQALEESEHRFRAIFESSQDAILIANDEGTCVQTNPAAKSIFGLPPEKMLGRPISEFVSGVYDNPSDWKAYLTSGVFLGETLFARADGSVRQMDCKAVANIMKDRHLFVLRDITERKQAEQALQQAKDELEMRVNERTAELKRRNQELQEFAFVAAHDMTEPLRKIQTFGSLLQSKSDDFLDEKSRDYLSRMTGAADRMRELLDALLRYSRIETKGEDFRPAKLNDVVQDAITDLEVAIRKMDAHVEIGPLPVVMGDPYQLRQMFQNLVANAVKYSRSEVKPVVGIYKEETNGACQIIVEDNGIGFDEKYLDKIFQPFQRLHARNEYTGTGIGLAICRKIAERHGWTITAKSTPGRGTAFVISLWPHQVEK